MKMIFIFLLMLTFAVHLSACNTVQGFGKDLQRGGEAIERTAK
ncbi:MAG TPA: entericidin A/B family lipoprotein [Nitrosomonas halophila]|nr:entericidin A/B family lipoprotein [Nitrosomonas halophila]